MLPTGKVLVMDNYFLSHALRSDNHVPYHLATPQINFDAREIIAYDLRYCYEG